MTALSLRIILFKMIIHITIHHNKFLVKYTTPKNIINGAIYVTTLLVSARPLIVAQKVSEIRVLVLFVVLLKKE